MNFDSPAKPKARRKSTAEPTMTMHTRAATNEIYDMFNQPLKAETDEAGDGMCDSDYEDDDCTSVGGDSTVTGRVSVASSDFGDDETTTLHRGVGSGDSTPEASVVGSNEWTGFNENEVGGELSSPLSKGSMTPPSRATSASDSTTTESKPERQRFIPEMPEDYDPPCGPYRDPAIVAQNRLPFMTPIVEQTEYSLSSATAARSTVYNSKTPSKPMQVIRSSSPGIPHIDDLLLSSPSPTATAQEDDENEVENDNENEEENLTTFTEIVPQSPTFKKARSPARVPIYHPETSRTPIIPDRQCNPNDPRIRDEIINSLNPSLTSYPGYYDHSKDPEYQAGNEIQKFVKAMNKRPKSGDSFSAPILNFPGSERNYILRRELGAGAYAPVYLADSIDKSDHESTRDRAGYEAIKMEIGAPNAWEFYMLRTAHNRIKQYNNRATDSIIGAHELHIFNNESVLIEDYRGQGTLLDLANIVHSGNIIEGVSGVEEALAMFFSVELFRTIEALHWSGIIHGDIKADNCLVRFDDNNNNNNPSPLIDLEEEEEETSNHRQYSTTGSNWRNKGLALIDFGRSIDMQAFQQNVQFIADWKTKDHECNEIREMRPWTYQTDLYGIAGTIHVLLFGKYMETIPSIIPTINHHKSYRIRESFKRYWDRDLWNDVFDLLLNPTSNHWAKVESSSGERPLPVLNSMRSVRERMETWLVVNAEKKGLLLQIKKLEAIFAEKKKRLER